MNLADKFSEIASQHEKIVEPVKFDIIEENSKLKFDSIIKNVEKIAHLGRYGSVNITLDLTTDLFNCNENTGRYYSAYLIRQMLVEENFKLVETGDYYDAKSYDLIWNSKFPKYKDSISMNINATID